MEMSEEMFGKLIIRLKDTFVTREECNDNVKEITNRITEGEKDTVAIKTKLNIIIGGLVMLISVLLPIVVNLFIRN